MDATLLRNDKTYEKEQFESLVNQLIDKGIAVCIASGNSYHKLVEFFSPMLIEQMYFAGDNGNYLIKNGRVERIIGIPKTEFVQIANYFDSLSDYFVSISTGQVTYLRETSGTGYEKILRYNNIIRQIDNFNEILDNESATKIAIFSENSLAKHKIVAKVVSELFSDIAVVTSGDQWIDAYHIQGGKGSAISYLQQKLGISAEESMAFGDSLNDETMMHEVKYSIAMENADRDLVGHCEYQIGSNENQAVIVVLQQLLEDLNATFMGQYKIN